MSIDGKIMALQPSFVLMAEVTGKPSTTVLMGLYAEYFAKTHISPDQANRAVRSILTGWSKPWWPDPEQIATRAIEIARQDALGDKPHNRESQIEETIAQWAAYRWEHRLTMANAWRTENPARFRTVLTQVNTVCHHVAHLHWQQESEAYRKSFRDGCIVQACNNQAGIDERRAARTLAVERAQRASQFAATDPLAGVVRDKNSGP